MPNEFLMESIVNDGDRVIISGFVNRGTIFKTSRFVHAKHFDGFPKDKFPGDTPREREMNVSCKEIMCYGKFFDCVDSGYSCELFVEGTIDKIFPYDILQTAE